MNDPKKAADIISLENSSDKGFEEEWKIEVNEWVESLEAVKDSYGQKQVKELLRSLQNFALSQGITLTEATLNTPYRNSIPLSEQPSYPGNLDLEKKIENIIRWNAMAMVLQAYDTGEGLGGHIATYASAATMTEVALNHFIKSISD